MFYTSRLTFNRFCIDNKLKCRNLENIWKASGLDKMKVEKVDIATAMQSLTSYLDTQNLQKTAKMKNLHKSNEAMTEDEVIFRIYGSWNRFDCLS